MPTTVNGIGTHYYGRSNGSVRTGTCASCGHVGPLESYDTRLWFVIFFIPVIPLGRKRIMDSCPACSRHFVASADAYEQTSQLQTSAGMERYQREPSPDTALAAHGQLMGFREHERAAEFRATILQEFPAHAGLRVGLAHQLRSLGTHDESAKLFQEALELDPADPHARAGVALRKMAEGNLDDARNLLAYMEEPGAGQQYSLEPLDILAGYYQRAGKHEEALHLSEILLRELPRVGNLHTFRAFVRTSEKALLRTESILPAREFSLVGLFRSEGSPYAPWQRYVVIGGTIAALVIAGLMINNDYIRRHRTLHVVNACGQPVQVQVDNEPPVSIQGRGQLTLSEGPHTIQIKGAVEETHTIELDSGYFDRWFKSPAWVLNPGKEAVLEEVTHIYSQSGQPGNQTLIVGEAFVSRPDIDYLFEKPPTQLTVKNKNTVVTKTELAVLEGRDVDAFYATERTNHQAAMDFAQRRLRRHPDQGALLKAVVARATDADRQRLAEFFKQGLATRPVNVAWHRTYQMFAQNTSTEKEMIAAYDGYLAAEPSDAALLYLRGRIESDANAAAAYFRRAVKADPKMAWPRIALASHAALWARWPEALDEARRAQKLSVEDAELLNEVLHTARLATGEAATLVSEYRDRLASNAMDPLTLFSLIDALVVSGKADEVETTLATWEGGLPPPLRSQIASHLKAFALYQAGKLEECAALCNQEQVLKHSPIRVHVLLAEGKARMLADDPEFAKTLEDPWNALGLSLALHLDGKADDAAAWRAKVIAKLHNKSPDSERVASVLGAAEAPPLDALGRVHIRLADKALLLAALAARFPAKQAEYLELAGKLNVRRTPPYHLVRRALDRLVGPKQ